jgi:hypothetical protein
VPSPFHREAPTRDTPRGRRASAYKQPPDWRAAGAQVWPGATHYPDFTSPQGKRWWQQQLAALHGSLPFDGLWLDMNEVGRARALRPGWMERGLALHFWQLQHSVG